MSEAGPSTSQTEASSDVDVEAATLLSTGRSNLLKEDAASAVLNLQEACELLGTKYGELANECGECYYYYGWALLELARMETGVLGNALEGVPEGDEADADTKGQVGNIEDPGKVEKEEREQIFHDVQQALEDKKAVVSDQEGGVSGQEGEASGQDSAPEKETGKGGAEKGEQKKEKKGEKKKAGEVTPSDNGDGSPKAELDQDGAEKPMDVDDAGKQEDSKQDGDEPKKVGKGEGADTSNEKADGAEDENSDGDGDGDDDGDDDDKGAEAASADDIKDEDVSNFQLSWEMLELARVIFSRQEGDEFKLKVSQVYLKLGELGLERGNYAQSVEDFTLCLKTQTEQLSKDSRLLAETHYNLALAYSFDQKFDKAIENFEQSTSMIQNRITKLKNKTKEGKMEEELAQDQKEIKELEALIPEIKLKIDDAKCEKNTMESAVGQAMTSAAAEFGLGTSSSSSASSSGFQQTSTCPGATVKPIAVRKPTDAKPDDISHLVHRKRKPQEDPGQETAGKKLRQEDGAGDAANAAQCVNGANGLEQTAMNGDAKQLPEATLQQIKVKQVETSNGDAQTATMET